MCYSFSPPETSKLNWKKWPILIELYIHWYTVYFLCLWIFLCACFILCHTHNKEISIQKIIWICFQWYTTMSKDHSSACRGRRKRPRVAMWISSASKASPYPTCPPWMTRPLQTKESSNSSRTAASTWSPLSPPPPNHFPRSNSLPREMLISKPEGLRGNEWHYASTGSKKVTLLFFFPRHNTAKLLMYNLCGSVVIRPKCYWFRLPILYDDFFFFFVYYFVRGTLYVHNLVSIWFCLWLWYRFPLNFTLDYHHQIENN